jgi:hypothetical protein
MVLTFTPAFLQSTAGLINSILHLWSPKKQQQQQQQGPIRLAVASTHHFHTQAVPAMVVLPQLERSTGVHANMNLLGSCTGAGAGQSQQEPQPSARSHLDSCTAVHPQPKL